jgi:hypothetical protein
MARGIFLFKGYAMKYQDVMRWTGAAIDCIGFVAICYLLFYVAMAI